MKKLVFSLMLLSLFSCSDDASSSDSTDTDTDVVVDSDDDSTDDDDETIVTEGDVDISSVVEEFYSTDNGVSVSVDEDSGVITVTSSTGLPDHKTPYYSVNNQDAELYEDFPSYYVTDAIYENFYIEMIADRIFNDDYTIITYAANDNDTIASATYTMEIPMFPAEADEKEDTELSAVGMALNGVPFFNDLNRDEDLLTAADVSTLDSAGGHPGANEDYHYHLGANPGIYAEEDPEVAYSTVIDEDNLVGFMRDGFPLYGLQEVDGSTPEDLDDYGGHIGVTEHFPDGIYHYHTNSEDFLDSGWHVLKTGQYYGTPGDFSSDSDDDTDGGGMPEMPEM